MKYVIKALIIVYCYSFCCIYGSTIDPKNKDSEYIDFGKKHDAVVAIVGPIDEKNSFFGSGTLLNENWVLTAAHVVDNAKSAYVKFENQIYVVEHIVIHKSYKKENVGIYDIAMCKLQEPIKIPSYPKLYTDHNETDKICSIAGCGMTGTLETGVVEFDKKKRAGLNKIKGVYKHLLICEADKGEKATGLEQLIASGDSGGGLFIDNKVAGVNSIVMASDGKADSSYGDESGHTRVSVFKDWILEVIKIY